MQAYATIWVREHNRVCDELLKTNPHWDDERVYQTARLIITGKFITCLDFSFVLSISDGFLMLKSLLCIIDN